MLSLPGLNPSGLLCSIISLHTKFLATSLIIMNHRPLITPFRFYVYMHTVGPTYFSHRKYLVCYYIEQLLAAFILINSSIVSCLARGYVSNKHFMCHVLIAVQSYQSIYSYMAVTAQEVTELMYDDVID